MELNYFYSLEQKLTKAWILAQAIYKIDHKLFAYPT